jgi:hypothetical protein
MDSVNARIVLLSWYESKYGIYNHFNTRKDRPMALISMHSESEDINDGSILEEAMSTYVKFNIKDTFGLSLDEFLNNPRDVCQMMGKIASTALAQKNRVVDEIEKGMNIK